MTRQAFVHRIATRSPDDVASLEAMIASTSTWQKTAAHPETMHALIHAYGEVLGNLLKHAAGWPESAELDARVFAGQTGYGMAATGTGKMSEGAKAILRAVDRG